MHVLGFRTSLALALTLLTLTLLTPAAGDVRQAPAQLRVEPAGCPSGYVHLSGGQCVHLKMARQYQDGDHLDPRATGFRPVRRRGRLWTDAWSGPGRAASNPEGRRVPARGVELEQRAGPAEVRQRPAERGYRGMNQRIEGQHSRRAGPAEVRQRPAEGGYRERNQRREGQLGRRAGQREGRRVMKNRRREEADRRREEVDRRQRAEEEAPAPTPLVAGEGDPATPARSSCPSGRLDRRGRCRDGRRRGTKGRSRDPAGRRDRNQTGDEEEPRRRRLRPCRKGFVRLSKGQCVRARGTPQEGAPTVDSSDAGPTQQQTPTPPAELPDGEVRPGEATEVAAGSPRRRQGQRRRGSQRRRGGRRQRPGGRPGARPDGRGPDSAQPDGGPQDSDRHGSSPAVNRPQDGGQPREGQQGTGAADSRTPDRGRQPSGRPNGPPSCPAGQVPWRRGRCVSVDRLQACPNGSQRQPSGWCVRCGLRPLPDTGRCPAGCARTDDKCTCCQPGRRL